MTREAVRFAYGDVLAIDVKAGARAVVQFLRIGDRDRFVYRWRYRAAGSETLAGSGEVEESYKRVSSWWFLRKGVEELPGHETIVRIGDLKAEWSACSRTEGYLYHHADRSTVRVLGPESFEMELA